MSSIETGLAPRHGVDAAAREHQIRLRLGEAGVADGATEDEQRNENGAERRVQEHVRTLRRETGERRLAERRVLAFGSTVKPRQLVLLLALGLAVFAPGRASAVFHLMQIEQVIGGVCGDATIQAVQLRMRASNQNLVAGTRLVAYDAEGANPVVLVTFPDDVANGAAGARILSISSEYGSQYGPSPDFTLTNLIPASYLPAGRLTFEDSGGLIYWSLAWGGAAYTGPTTGEIDNDDDGDFGPPWDGQLPSSSGRALQFQGAFGDLSTTNAADYALTAGDAQFTNNGDASGTVADCLFGDGFESGDPSLWTNWVP